MRFKRFMLSSYLLGSTPLASAEAPVDSPCLDPTLMPVVTSIVITAPYGQPPEIRITVTSPYGGAKITTEDKATMPPPRPQPPPAPLHERRPTATIGEPVEGPVVAPRSIPAATPPVTRPLSPAQRAARLEAPYRRIPSR